MRKATAIKRLSARTPQGRYLRVEISLILYALCSKLIVFESQTFSNGNRVSTILEKALVNESSNTRCHPRSEDSYDAERR
jgi:hypothetical protein